MCAISHFNIIVDRLQPIEEISEGDPEGYDDMPELIDDLPDLEPIERPEDDENPTEEQPQEDVQEEEQQQPLYETQRHREILERLYFNLRVLNERRNV
jgi:hypothetical protein